MPSDLDRAYLAGQIDADGSICLTANNTCKTLMRQVQLYSQDIVMLKWVQSEFGGSIYKCGRVMVWKPKHRAAFCKEIIPFLRTKRPQAELLVESSLGWKMTPELITEYVTASKYLNGQLPKNFAKEASGHVDDE